MQPRRTSDATPARKRPSVPEPPNIFRLMVFHALVDEGTMSKASERLFITQPAISAHIKALESGLGVALFDRVGRRSVVNAAGKVLYEKSEQLFSAVDELKTAMEDVRGISVGRLSLGASVVWQYHLPRTLNRFKQQYPAVELSVQVGSSDHIERLVLDRSVDIGFVGRASERAELASEYLGEDEVVPICAPTHPLAGAGNEDSSYLDADVFIVREAGSATRRATDAMMAGLDAPPRISMALGSQEAIKQVVLAGQGLGMVSRGGSASELRAGLLAIAGIAQLRSSLRLHAIYYKRKTLTRAQRAFLEFVATDAVLSGSRQSGEDVRQHARSQGLSMAVLGTAAV